MVYELVEMCRIYLFGPQQIFIFRVLFEFYSLSKISRMSPDITMYASQETLIAIS